MVGLRLCFCVSVDTAPLSSHPSVRWLRSLRCLRLGRRAPPHGQGICEFATTRKKPLAAGTTPRQVSPRIRYFLRTGMARVMKKPGLYAIAERAIFSVRANFFAPKFCGRAALPAAALRSTISVVCDGAIWCNCAKVPEMMQHVTCIYNTRTPSQFSSERNRRFTVLHTNFMRSKPCLDKQRRRGAAALP